MQEFHILLVDDELDTEFLFQSFFKKWIKEKKVKMSYASSAEEALTMMNDMDECVNLVLSDINMPGISGIELLKKLREKFGPVNVMMMTAYDNEDYRVDAESAGASNYFTKPLDFNKLKEEIAKLEPSIAA